MASDQPVPHALGRLILDYLRAFLWPAVVLAVVLIYQDDVRNILETREVKIAGVFELGQQVAQIEEQTGEELADISSLLAALRERSDPEANALVTDIETKLTKVEQNLNQQVDQIQAARPQARAPAESAPDRQPSAPAATETAAELERRGFEALLARNVGAATDAFEAAFAHRPDYHNVDEIRRLLKRHARALADLDPDAWSKLYRVILTDYSWGMPKDLRPEFRRLAVASYDG